MYHLSELYAAFKSSRVYSRHNKSRSQVVLRSAWKIFIPSTHLLFLCVTLKSSKHKRFSQKNKETNMDLISCCWKHKTFIINVIMVNTWRALTFVHTFRICCVHSFSCKHGNKMAKKRSQRLFHAFICKTPQKLRCKFPSTPFDWHLIWPGVILYARPKAFFTSALVFLFTWTMCI